MVWISTERVVAARMNEIYPVQTQINVLIMLVVLVSTVLKCIPRICKAYKENYVLLREYVSRGAAGAKLHRSLGHQLLDPQILRL